MEKKIIRSRWDKMDIFHLSWETLQYIICDAYYAEPWSFINKHYRGICHKIINRVGHKFDATYPLRCTHTAVAYSTVFGGYSLFPWLLINSVILAHPTGQSPRGPIYPNETQRHFTPKKIQLTVKGPTLALGNHAKGSKKVSDLLEKLFSGKK